MSLNCGHQWAYCSSPRRYMRIGSHSGTILTEENRLTRRKTYSNATLYTTNPIRTELGANSGPCGERPATVWDLAHPHCRGCSDERYDSTLLLIRTTSIVNFLKSIGSLLCSMHLGFGLAPSIGPNTVG
jgi:hypothetical protein